MGYEYEEEIVQQNLSDFRLFGRRFHTQKSRESREVYAKAKAFDEVIKKVKTEYVSEDLADYIRILVNDYEYDKEDK